MWNPTNYIPETWSWPEGNSRQMSVSNKKDSISNAVPLCLPNNYTWDSVTKKISVDKTKPRKTLTVCKEGLELLQRLKDQLLVVLCIAGPARSGKSFFASQLQEDVNFDVGHGAGSHTIGIWIGVGARPIRIGNDEARVVILDAEGLGGVNTDSNDTDAKWEHKIFSLCVLLSSYVIYNSRGPPNNDELDKLGFIAEFSRSILREKQDDVEEQKSPREGFDQFGPDFLWLFRDIFNGPEINGKSCDWTDYVNKKVLVLKPNEPDKNNIRKSISSTFRKIRAADLPPPTTDSNAIKDLLAKENKDKIRQDFFPRIQNVGRTIWSSVKIKTIKGSKLTGQQLIDILSHVVNSVNSECDKLDVTSMWDSIVNEEMRHYIQSALDLYKEKMEQVELPEKEETYLKRHESTKSSSKVHFERVTTRFDKDICSSQLQILCDKIEIEFNNSLMIKNEQASLIFNKKLITDLENIYFNNLPAKSSCMQLKTANKEVNDFYKKGAKGPKAGQVKSEAQLLRDQKIDIMRTESLIDAEQKSCELFEKSLKEALEGEPLTLSELNALKGSCINGCLNNFRKASCDDVDCIHCIKCKQSLHQKVESIFKECSSECYDQSAKACQCLINELITRMLLPFLIKIDSHNYSDFRNLKDEILAQYDREAKGPAKGDLMGTCTKTIDMQKEGIQLLIMQSALKSVYCEYTRTLNQTAKSDPCEDEELDRRQALKYTEITSAFGVKCEGIDKSKVEPYQLNLEDVIKHFTKLIANENKSRSINLCEDLVTSLSREFHDGILQTHIPEILRETECSQCSDHLRKAEKFKDKILTDYEQKACGPEKERFQQSLNEYLEIHLIIVKEAVNEMILKTVLQHHFYQLDTIKQKYPINETELRGAISETNKNTEKEFIDAQKQISLPFVGCRKDILSIILNFDTIQLVEENYKLSMKQLDSICKDISLESRKKFEELVLSGEADTAKFVHIRGDCIKELEKSGKGVLKDHYKSILQGNVDLEIRIAHTTIADNTVKRIFADCRTSIENLVQRNPREQDDLEYDIERVKADAREKIENLQIEVAEANLTGTEEILTIELKDTICYVVGKNLCISSEKCAAQLLEVLEELKGYCENFLASETSVIDNLRHLKDKFLRKFDEVAIGPAKADDRNKLADGIVEEVDRTFVLFAKAKYGQILREEIQQFQFEDLLKNPDPESIGKLVQLLKNKVDYILNTYPTLEETTRNNLTRDLEESINRSLLKELATVYEETINHLKDRGILEEDELKDEINTAKGIFDIHIPRILGNDYDLPEELQTFIDTLERNLQQDNFQRSRISCQKTFQMLFQYNWDYLTKGYFRKFYNEKSEGPARQTVWDENEERVDVYYNSYKVMFRKMWAPLKYLNHKV
ncbi:uncharacterized protein [Apostichopus japonicus]|uniref:uncharacterized protein n=1 Tax=Stichopus japonicus TaxID=307972 RepID=UPI003AB6A8B5